MARLICPCIYACVSFAVHITNLTRAMEFLQRLNELFAPLWPALNPVGAAEVRRGGHMQTKREGVSE